MQRSQSAAQQESAPAVPLPGPALPAATEADDSLAWKLGVLEWEQKELQSERSTLLQDLAKAKTALAKNSSTGEIRHCLSL